MAEFQPDLAIGTTPVVQAAKQASIPSLYFTNLISARPLMIANPKEPYTKALFAAAELV
jgi:hypothetical protein